MLMLVSKLFLVIILCLASMNFISLPRSVREGDRWNLVNYLIIRSLMILILWFMVSPLLGNKKLDEEILIINQERLLELGQEKIRDEILAIDLEVVMKKLKSEIDLIESGGKKVIVTKTGSLNGRDITEEIYSRILHLYGSNK